TRHFVEATHQSRQSLHGPRARNFNPSRRTVTNKEGSLMDKVELEKVEHFQKHRSDFIQQVIKTPVAPAAAGTQAQSQKHRGVVKWSRNFVEMSIEEVFCDEQPRTTFDEEYIEQLAQSILAIGQKVPVLVSYDETRGKWKLILGECRYRA